MSAPATRKLAIAALILLILAAAMVINLVVAGIAGALIPISLKALKIDPAIASMAFVTTFADVCGFFAFPGLATAVLHGGEEREETKDAEDCQYRGIRGASRHSSVSSGSSVSSDSSL